MEIMTNYGEVEQHGRQWKFEDDQCNSCNLKQVAHQVISLGGERFLSP